MRTMILLMMLSLSFTACNAQEKKEKDELEPKAENAEKPKGSWKVNREFDENGNLISYDSTYVYSWSSVEGDSIDNANADEIFKNFRQYFYRQNGNTGLMNSFMNDSLYGGNDFFEDEFFSNRMMSRHFQEQIRYMDSIRNEFLKQNYPEMYEDSRPLIPRKEKENDGMI